MSADQLSSGGATGDAVAEMERNDVVTITVNNEPWKIHRGRRTVVEIKISGHVPIADDLEQIIDGQMHLLQDDGHVVIHGRELFVSHPKSTSSS
jgi:hypothetical protein